MGVTGLWPLLEPVGRRVSIQTLANKRLAVGALSATAAEGLCSDVRIRLPLGCLTGSCAHLLRCMLCHFSAVVHCNSRASFHAKNACFVQLHTRTVRVYIQGAVVRSCVSEFLVQMHQSGSSSS